MEKNDLRQEINKLISVVGPTTSMFDSETKTELNLLNLRAVTLPQLAATAEESLLTNFGGYINKRFSATKLSLFENVEEITVLGIFEEDVEKAFQILKYGEPEHARLCIKVAEGKTTNNMRPQWYRSNDKKHLALVVFPGVDYVLHYGLCLKAYLRIYGISIEVQCKISRLSAKRITEHTKLAEFVGKLYGYVVVIGPTHEIKSLMKDHQQFSKMRTSPLEMSTIWYSQKRYKNKNGVNILLLDIKYCFWGSISKYVARCLYEMGATEIIHCGKVGNLVDPERQHKLSIPHGRYIYQSADGSTWTPLSLENHIESYYRKIPNILPPDYCMCGSHVSVPSVLLETFNEWKKYTKDAAATIDAEVAYIAHEAHKLGKRFSCVHWISDFLVAPHVKEEVKSKGGLHIQSYDKEVEAKQNMSKVLVGYLSFFISVAEDYSKNFIGQNLSFALDETGTSYIRHYSGVGLVKPYEPTEEYHTAATWQVIPGLVDPSAVTLVPVNLPAHCLRHRFGDLYIQQRENNYLYLNDATFHIYPGLSDVNGISFHLKSHPTHFIQNINGALKTGIVGDKSLATFYVKPALKSVLDQKIMFGQNASRFTVKNVTDKAISVFVSKFSHAKGQDDWFVIDSGNEETWKRYNWELIAIKFDDGDRRGLYLLPPKDIVVSSKDIIEIK